MSRGFLGYDASLMLDVVVCALALVVPVLVWSIWTVRVRRNFRRHRDAQVALGVLLLVTVIAFEIDMRLQGGWVNIVNKPGEPPRLSPEELAPVRRVLLVHLVFAVSTPVLWATTMWLALRRFPSPPGPDAHSRRHRLLGWLTAADLTLTSITGLVFYYVAFISER